MPPVADPVKEASIASGGAPTWRAKICPVAVAPPRQKGWGLKTSPAARSASYRPTSRRARRRAAWSRRGTIGWGVPVPTVWIGTPGSVSTGQRVRRRQPEGGQHHVGVVLGQEPRRLLAHHDAAHAPVRRQNVDPDRSDPQLEADRRRVPGRGQAPQLGRGEDGGDRRVSGHRDLLGRHEVAGADVGARRAQHERGLGEDHLPRDRLHRLLGEPVRVEDYGAGVAGEGPVGEGVDLEHGQRRHGSDLVSRRRGRRPIPDRGAGGGGALLPADQRTGWRPCSRSPA